jgi:hypothetical protein
MVLACNFLFGFFYSVCTWINIALVRSLDQSPRERHCAKVLQESSDIAKDELPPIFLPCWQGLRLSGYRLGSACVGICWTGWQ